VELRTKLTKNQQFLFKKHGSARVLLGFFER